MRTVSAVVVILCAAASPLQPALAQDACGPDSGKLGVSRTIAVDASKGPQFGAQYRGGSLLKDGEVILTFDDGPSRPYTRPILEALAAECTKATFFMVGRMAVADPEMVKEVARHGHTVATHTWSHGNLQGLSPQGAETEIELGFSAVQHALGKPVAPFFRFPYLRDSPYTLSHLQGRQLATFGIDIDSRDFETRDAAVVQARVKAELTAKRRGVILMHDIHASTAKALPLLLADLKERGFRVVHITAKAGAETVAEYDALAQREVERKRLAGAGHPFAKRSITWPSTIFSDARTTPRRAPKEPPEEEDWTVNVWRQ